MEERQITTNQVFFFQKKTQFLLKTFGIEYFFSHMQVYRCRCVNLFLIFLSLVVIFTTGRQVVRDSFTASR